MHRSQVLWLGLLLAGCGEDPLVGALDAVRSGDHHEAVVKLRPIAATSTGDPTIDTKIDDTYVKALADYRDELSGPTASMETCDGAMESLSAIKGFAEPASGNGGEEAGVEGEVELLTQALLCSARHRIKGERSDEAAKVVIDGMKRLPGFEPGSSFLAKVLREPAFTYARAGSVVEATSLAQVVFAAGDRGLASAIMNTLETSGAGADDVFPVLADRANRAKISAAASSLAADFGLWHGKAADAERWYDEVAASAAKGRGEHAKELVEYAGQRSEEASRAAQNSNPLCTVEHAGTVVAEVPYVAALAAAPVEGGVAVVWIEGEKAPQQGVKLGAEGEKAPPQSLKMARVSPDGSKGTVVTLADVMPPAPPAKASDVWAPYAIKNRLPSLELQKCGGVTEVVARGAPEGGWVRAALADDGSVASPVALMPPMAKEAPMPNEDVRSRLGCADGRMVYMWLANIQLMRLGWFTKGVPSGKVVNLRLPGFSPGFVAFGQEGEATNVTWIDIMGEDMSRVISLTLAKNGEIPMVDPPPPAEGEEPSTEKVMDLRPVSEEIGSRIEQIKLAEADDTRAVVFYPKRNDILARFLDRNGRATGSEMSVVALRTDANKLLFDATIAGRKLGVAWAETLTDRWGTVTFQSVGVDGRAPSPPQRLAGLARPDITPVVTAVGDAFTVTWVDHTADEGESIRMSVVRCGGR